MEAGGLYAPGGATCATRAARPWSGWRVSRLSSRLSVCRDLHPSSGSTPPVRLLLDKSRDWSPCVVRGVNVRA
eukprot:scaffold59673_cov65-Phaeocystis_antarctica.AAC.1